MAWTTPVTQATGVLITAAIWNAQVPDNMAYLHGDAGLVALTDAFTSRRIAHGSGADLTLTSAVLDITDNVHRIAATSGGTLLTTINAPSWLPGMFLALFNATGAPITVDATSDIMTPAAGTITVSGDASSWGCLVLILSPTAFTKYAVVSYF